MYNDNSTEETVKKNSLLSIALKWALISTLLSVIYQMIMLTLNDGRYEPRPEGWYHMVIGTLLMLFTVTMSIKEYRDRGLDGFITYGKAFKAGMIYSLLNAIFLIVFLLILYNLIIDWDVFYAEQLDKGIEMMKKRGLSDDEITKNLSQTPEFLKSQTFSLLTVFIFSIIIHLIVVAIIAAVLRRSRPEHA